MGVVAKKKRRTEKGKASAKTRTIFPLQAGGRRPFDATKWTPQQDPRLVVFFFESPEPFMLPDGATYSIMLGREVEWLRNISMHPVEGLGPLPEEDWNGQLFASFRFWRSSVDQAVPLPSDALMEKIKLVMPAEVVKTWGVGIVGPDEDDISRAYQAVMKHGDEPGRASRRKRQQRAPRKLRHHVSIIEAVTPLLPSEHDASPIVEALHRCIEPFADLSRVYRLSNRLPMRPITYERLPPVVFWATRKLVAGQGDQWDEGLEMLLFPERMPGRMAHDELGDEGIERFNMFYGRYLGGNPIVAYSERTLEARLSFDTLGDYPNCVIQCQTALEVLFDSLLSMLLWEEGVEPDAAAKIFAESLHKRIRTYFGPRLGGDWNTKGRGPVAAWAQHLVPLRNRVVHAAYPPTRLEAGNALATVTDIDNHFRARLVATRNRYPRTTLMILGRPGLERYGAWSGKIKRFVEEGADDEPNWDRAFSHWRGHVLDLGQDLESQSGRGGLGGLLRERIWPLLRRALESRHQ
jgi:hypothetical protein